MIKISNNIDRDIEFIKYMIDNNQKAQLSPGTMKFLVNYLIEYIEKNIKRQNNKYVTQNKKKIKNIFIKQKD